MTHSANTLSVDTLVRNASVSPELFGVIAPAGKTLKSYGGFPKDHAFQVYVPDVDSDYVFEPTIRQAVLMWINFPQGQSLWVSGPTGCGKTSIIEQTAARLNWPTMKTTASADLDINTFIGGLRIKCNELTGDTKTVYELGPLSMAYKYGMIFLLDEYDQLEPSCANAFNAILEGGNLTIPETNEVIKKHPNFRFVATANSIGQGDTTGVYGGVKTLNVANLDRYMFINTKYMPEDVETVLISKFVSDHTVASKFVEIANKIRKQFIGTELSSTDLSPQNYISERLSVTCSTRSLKAWVQRYMLMRKASIDNALFTSFDYQIGNRASVDEKKALHSIIESVFGSDLA